MSFDFVAVEADWPDAARIDEYVSGRGAPRARFSWTPFTRFPAWMWRNEDVAGFTDWLRAHNAERGEHQRAAGFHGLDLYSMYTSIALVVSYLDEIDPEAGKAARRRYAQLMPWQDTPQGYGRAVLVGRLEAAEDAVVATLRDLLRRRLEYVQRDGDRFFDAAQNARLVTSAERYYRAIFRSSAESWNLRDSHMFETLRSLLAYYGPTSKGIVWAHNTHVGNAHATEMLARHEHNLGQLCRQAFGDAVRLVGFGTDHGTVAAASDWDEPVQTMTVRSGHPESYERVFHEAAVPAFALSLRDPVRRAVRDELTPARLLRAIGVVYRPETELVSHYLEVVLPEQFDEFLWFDSTTALVPLSPAASRAPVPHDLPDTYPFGF